MSPVNPGHQAGELETGGAGVCRKGERWEGKECHMIFRINLYRRSKCNDSLNADSVEGALFLAHLSR